MLGNHDGNKSQSYPKVISMSLFRAINPGQFILQGTASYKEMLLPFSSSWGEACAYLYKLSQ